jgi:hypothetical protein
MRGMLLAGTSLLAVAGLTGLSGAAAAQGVRALQPGAAAVTSTIDSSDPALVIDSSNFELWQIPVRAGDRVNVTMRSSAFAPVLMVGYDVGPDGCETCVSGMAERGEAGGAVASFDATEAGFLKVLANTLNPGESGNYTLAATVTRAPQANPVMVRFGSTTDGALSRSDWRDADRQFTDVYRVQLTRGQKVQIDLSSQVEEFDPYLEMVRVGSDAEPVMDDDSGPGRNARIRTTVTTAGVYEIRVRSLSGEPAGAYTMTVGRDTSPPPVAPTPLPIGPRVGGSLGATTPMIEESGDPIRAVQYRFLPQEGRPYIITVKSEDFDPVLTILGESEDGPYVLDQNDDVSDEDRNSRVRTVFPGSAPAVLRVTGFGEDAEGRFEVQITPVVLPPLPAAGRSVRAGDTIAARLADGGTRTREDALADFYQVTLKAGDRVRVQMVKSDDGDSLDPYVAIGTGTPGAFEELDSSDDSAGSLNSDLKFIAPEDGTYVIVARALGAGQDGAYELRVSTFEPPPPPPPPQVIGLGATVSGTLDENDPQLEPEGQPYERFQFEARAGEEYVIEATGENVDTYVEARAASAGDEDWVGDDDSGGELNPRLDYTVSASGTQIIRLRTFSPGNSGAYTLRVSRKGN